MTTATTEPLSITKGSPIAWPLVSVWLDDDDPLYDEGPWRVLRRAALRSSWRVEGLFSRGNTLTATGGVGGLTDALSLRFRHRYSTGTTYRAVGLWTRTTWPTLGRAAAREADDTRAEGRRSSEGKTWLWHPPTQLPEDGLITFPKWSFDQGWTWTSQDRSVRRKSAADLKKWITMSEGN